MRVNKPLALLAVLVTLWPPIYFAMFMASFFGGVRGTASPESMPIFGSFETMIVFHLATMVVMMALMVFYIVHAFRNPALASDKRLLWVVVLFFGSFVAGLIYWWFYVWRQPAAVDPGLSNSSIGPPSS